MTMTFPQESHGAAPDPARPPKWYYDEARRMTRDGMAQDRIAEILGVSSRAVRRALYLVDGVRRRRRLFDRGHALRLRTEGLSNRKIAKLLGVTNTAVIKALRRSA